MSQPKIPPERKLAASAWFDKDYETGRQLYRACVDGARAGEYNLGPAFYLAEWAYMEATIGNRANFDSLYNEVFSEEPSTPYWRLSYARELWTEFRDAAACIREIEVLEEFLASERWDRSMDLAPLAYNQKIATLRAWIEGKPGGLWP